jgi:hypothetical protein
MVALVNRIIAEIHGPSDRSGVNPELLTDKINDADLGRSRWFPLAHAAAA